MDFEYSKGEGEIALSEFLVLEKGHHSTASEITRLRMDERRMEYFRVCHRYYYYPGADWLFEGHGFAKTYHY